jgi:hypothetical protein
MLTVNQAKRIQVATTVHKLDERFVSQSPKLSFNTVTESANHRKVVKHYKQVNAAETNFPETIRY